MGSEMCIRDRFCVLKLKHALKLKRVFCLPQVDSSKSELLTSGEHLCFVSICVEAMRAPIYRGVGASVATITVLQGLLMQCSAIAMRDCRIFAKKYPC